MLAVLHGGCMAPIAAWGRIEGEQLVLTGRVLNPAGTRKLEATQAGRPEEAESLGRSVATCCWSAGGRRIDRGVQGVRGMWTGRAGLEMGLADQS